MTRIELQRRNLIASLQYGLITWQQYFTAWLELHKDIKPEDL